MISKDFSLAIMVTDAKKSAAWYKEKLGFTAEIEDHWVTVSPKGAKWKLHLCEGDLEPGNTGVALYSADLKGTVADLKKKDVKFVIDYTKKAWGEISQFKDPDGNLIWVMGGSP